MTRFRAFWAALLLTIPAWPAFSATLNFMVVETGFSGDEGPSAGNFESSALWENCLLDLFFEAGHVVSNSPILRPGGLSAAGFPGGASAGEFPPPIRGEMEAAVLGGADYLILVLLSYPPGAADPKAKPEAVSFRVFSVDPAGGLAGCRLVYEGGAPLEAPERAGGNPPQGGAEAGQARGLIQGLVPHIRG